MERRTLVESMVAVRGIAIKVDDMGLFNFFKRADINEGVKAFRQNPNSVLLDVRTPEEYDSAHVEGSKNIPLQTIADAEREILDKSTVIYVHCRSGARSAQAVSALKKMGYTNVNDVGGILDYKGEVVKG